MISIMVLSDDDLITKTDDSSLGFSSFKSDVIKQEYMYDVVVYKGKDYIQIFKNRFGRVKRLSFDNSIYTLLDALDQI